MSASRDSAAWLASRPRIPLYPAIRRRPRSWWRRWLDGYRPAPAIGELRAEPDTLITTGVPGARLRWTEPFAVQLSASPEDGELAVRLRPTGDGDPIGFRTLVTTGWLERLDAPHKKEAGPFVLPEQIAPLWATLRHHTELHGLRRLPPWDEPDAALLARDSSGPLETCPSCGSARLAPLARQVYRCRDCGYEGGDGLATRLELERHATLDALQGAERAERLDDSLEQARLTLLAAIGDHRMAVNRDNEAELALKHGRIAGAAMQARQLLRDARVLVDDDVLAAHTDALLASVERATHHGRHPGPALLEQLVDRIGQLQHTIAQTR